MNKKYWVCIIEPKSMKQFNKLAKNNIGLDSPPRRGAMDNLENVGVKIKNCWSGWDCDKKTFNKIMKIWNE